MSPEDFLKQRYEAAADAHDLDAILALIGENAVYFFSNGTAYLGKDEIAKAIAANFAAVSNEQFELRDVSCLLNTGEVAVLLYEFHWSGDVNGRLVSSGGRGTTVLEKADGSWMVMHEHLSQGPFKGER